MNIIEKMHQFKDSYTSNEQKLYQMIIKNPDLIHTFTITQIAGFADVSTSAMLRFCKRLGFNGYKDFKFEMDAWLRSESAQSASDNPLQKIASSFSDAIMSIPEACGDGLNKLSTDILSSDKVMCFGRYRNKIVCDKFRMNLTDLGIPCLVASDLLSYEHSEKLVDSDTTVIIFSVYHDMKSYQSIIEEISSITDKLWLVTCNIERTKHTPIHNILLLPNISNNYMAVDQQAVMIAFVEMLTYILRQK